MDQFIHDAIHKISTDLKEYYSLHNKSLRLHKRIHRDVDSLLTYVYRKEGGYGVVDGELGHSHGNRTGCGKVGRVPDGSAARKA